MSLSRATLGLAALAIGFARAAIVEHNFNVGWVHANPDNAFTRSTIGINGKWPLPAIEANVGDTIVVNVTQCAIPPGGSFTYRFKVEQHGTYWYHSHTHSQYPDGLRGPLIIHDPQAPFRDQYDEELVLTLSDWYHDQMSDLIPQFLAKSNPTGAEPVPQAALMNETQDLAVRVEPGKTYLFRAVNLGAFASQYLWFEGHTMTIVEVDGVYTKPAETNMIYLSAGQRCSFLLTAKKDTHQNFAFVGSMDIELFDVLPDELNWNVTGWLVYNEDRDLPKALDVAEFEPIDDMTLVPYDEAPLLPEPDRTVELNVVMDNLRDGANYAFFNNITYKAPKVPTLYTVLTAGDMATNARIYGEYTHSFVLEQDEIVQIVVNNHDDGRHPFHLHGHQFQAVYRSEEDAGDFDEAALEDADFPAIPIRRDTLVVWPNGNIVLRFKANNPGVWLFHCHIEWHVVSGLVATFIEAPEQLQEMVTIPKDHLRACADGNVPTKGNAAGHTRDLLDLSGQNTPPPPLPEGFTTGGIIAFLISCLMGVLGVTVVGWYGITKPDEDQEPPQSPTLAPLINRSDDADEAQPNRGYDGEEDERQ
ncbi:unnamed protein product [Parascedosporium putredinis]|uniref:Iron transport multicopper oxidase FET3 n=1 Tax=Parascedosporium putredinis TaxID=1442378 RepID=A0A9P1GZE9_9PEZI|nr:unnamed protein product [Parascedosporium putredinis]CAI7991047.1 unnamed protein product [Parascedosporium putredinis]